MKKGIFLLLFIVFIDLIFLLIFNFKDINADNKLSLTRGKIYVVPIHGKIDRKLVIFLKRSIEKIENQRGNVVVFDIDTFGGRVDSALEITTLIGSLDQSTTIAYVNAGAASRGVSWSAGALISFSCNKIYMAPGTSIGAAAPVTITQSGMEAASEKVVSAVRAQIAALAEKNGYPPDVAKAMVDKDIELKEVLIDGKPFLISSDRIEEVKRKAEEEGKRIEIGRTVLKAGKLLTLTANQMEKYGISSGTPKSIEDLAEQLGFKRNSIVYINQSSADRIVGFIASPAVIALLIAIGLVSLYIEITTPGFGIPGTIAIIAFATIFIANTLLGTVNSIELLLFLIGVILLILEIFVIPGFGIAGISGIILIVVSLVFSMQRFVIPSFGWQRDIIIRNFLTVGVGVISSFVIFGILSFIIPKSKIFSKLALTMEQKKEIGYTVQPDEFANRYLGKRGIAVTNLRPAGKVKIDGEVIDVESDGEFVEKESEVEVIEISSNKIVVRKC